MIWLQRLSTLLFVIALPVLLVTTNVRIVASDTAFYERGFREYDAAETTGVPLPELDRAAREIVAYFENDARMLRIVVERNGEEVALFNPDETEHMRDVKDLMRVVYRLNEISVAVVLSFIAGRFLWAGHESLRILARDSLVGVGVGLLAVGAVGAFALTGFDETWNRFHELVFTNDLWRLDPETDRLIQMFPEAFWEEMTYLVGIATIAEATIITVVSVAILAFGARTPNGHDDPIALPGIPR